MKKVLIIGARGMLGQELVRIFRADKAYAVTGWDREEIDITDAAEVDAKISGLKPAIVLNAAAYNAVDRCEDEKEYRSAQRLNGKAPGHLARAAEKARAILVHFSSDYVFSGEPEINLEPSGCTHSCSTCRLHADFRPEIGFKEDARPHPINRYGRTKLAGEKAVAQGMKRYYIIRLSKLFGKPGKAALGKKSFFETMLEAGQKRKTVRVVDGETSAFTYAPDLARKTKEIIESGKPFGIYHVTNGGADTWFEAARELFRLAKLRTRAIPVPPADFPRPARRPEISTLINTKLNPLRSYQAALADFLKKQKRA